jgi:hypothetical protein
VGFPISTVGYGLLGLHLSMSNPNRGAARFVASKTGGKYFGKKYIK